MLSMLIMYLRWIIVYKPQMEQITDQLAKWYYGIHHRPEVIDYMIALLKELSIIGIILGIAALTILAIDVLVFGDEDGEIEETEEIYYKE